MNEADKIYIMQTTAVIISQLTQINDILGNVYMRLDELEDFIVTESPLCDCGGRSRCVCNPPSVADYRMD